MKDAAGQDEPLPARETQTISGFMRLSMQRACVHRSWVPAETCSSEEPQAGRLRACPDPVMGVAIALEAALGGVGLAVRSKIVRQA